MNNSANFSGCNIGFKRCHSYRDDGHHCFEEEADFQVRTRDALPLSAECEVAGILRHVVAEWTGVQNLLRYTFTMTMRQEHHRY